MELRYKTFEIEDKQKRKKKRLNMKCLRTRIESKIETLNET